MAGGLAARGVARGDVIALHLPNLPEFPIALHGALRAGARGDHREPALHRARARRPGAPLAGAAARHRRRPARRHRARGGRRRRGARARRAARPGRRAARTSGPTRTPPRSCCRRAARPACPKLVELTHRALVANLVQMELPFPAFEGGRLLGLAPFFHSMGLQCVLHRGLGAGAAIVALARFDLEGTLRAMQEHRVDQALVAPPLLAALVNHPVVDGYDLSSLTLLGSGGAPLDPGLERAAGERFACVVGSGYGISEAGPLVAVPSFHEPEAIRVGTLRPADPGHRGAGGRRRGLAARAAAVLRLPRRPRRHGRHARRRRLAAHRRSRLRRRGRLRDAHGPQQGADQGQRLPGRARRARAAAARAPGGGRRLRGRRARREQRRAAEGVGRRAAARSTWTSCAR